MKLSKSGSVDIKNDNEMANTLYPNIKNYIEIGKRERGVSEAIEKKRYNYKEQLIEKKMKLNQMIYGQKNKKDKEIKTAEELRIEEKLKIKL